MNVLVDTSVWSEVFMRRISQPSVATELVRLIQDGRASMVGPVRQEILSGISQRKMFLKLRERLRAFEDIALRCQHFETAAHFSNVCRRKGIQGSTIDFLLSAVSVHERMLLFTLDRDFERYAKFIPLRLYQPGG